MHTADIPQVMHTVTVQSWLTEPVSNGYDTESLRQGWPCCLHFVIFCSVSSGLHSHHCALQHSLLHYMGLSYMQTAEALSSVLKSNDTLREIDLSGNALGVEGGRSLREALTENMYVHRLPAFFACQNKYALHHAAPIS